MREPEPDRGAAEAPFPHLDWLFARQRFGMREGLDTMQQLLLRLGSPQLQFDTVLVAGTNGKGSVARVLAACLQASGARTGLFTSPHLQRVGERASVDGDAAEDPEMERLVGAVRGDAEELGATFFEVVTAACLLRFVEQRVDVAVLEVGLGGRLDATNVAAPDLTLITGVALDHTAVLGSTAAAIASEKAGILRPGVHAVTGTEGEALGVMRERAAELGAPLHVLREGLVVEDVTSGWGGVQFRLRWRPAAARGVPLALSEAGAIELRSPMLGRHQADNVALAAYGALLLGVAPTTVQAAVAATAWPGRMERRQLDGRRVLLDGAHNQQAARALALETKQLLGEADVLVLGVSGDKDLGAIVSELGSLAAHTLLCAASNSPRSAEPEALLAVWRAVGAPGDAETVGNPAAALTRALELCPLGGTVVVAGSLFLVAECLNLLDGEAGEPFERWQ